MELNKSDQALIAFFAANASQEDAERYRYSNDKSFYKSRTVEQAKMVYAKTMLDKYKEFLKLCIV